MAYTPEQHCDGSLPADITVTHEFDEETPDTTAPCVGELYGAAVGEVKTLANLDTVAAEFMVDPVNLGVLAMDGETQELCRRCGSACTIQSLRPRVR